jgi:regulatory protein
MRVTQIIDMDKQRSRIFIDGEFAFVLYKGELREYHICEGCEISDELYSEIMNVVLIKRCRLRAMNLLQKRDYTTKGLTDKLREGLYPQQVIDDAIKYVQSYRYLDDERYARNYISYQMDKRSRNRIIQDLSTKGIDRDMIMSLIEELYLEDGSEAELDQIRRLLIKKKYDPENCDFKESQKIIAFLMRKGFSLSDINRAMNDL